MDRHSPGLEERVIVEDCRVFLGIKELVLVVGPWQERSLEAPCHQLVGVGGVVGVGGRRGGRGGGRGGGRHVIAIGLSTATEVRRETLKQNISVRTTLKYKIKSGIFLVNWHQKNFFCAIFFFMPLAPM